MTNNVPLLLFYTHWCQNTPITLNIGTSFPVMELFHVYEFIFQEKHLCSDLLLKGKDCVPKRVYSFLKVWHLFEKGFIV